VGALGAFVPPLPELPHVVISGNSYTKIYSTNGAFAVLKADGSIAAWGGSGYGGTGAPSGKGYTKIYSNGYAFMGLLPLLRKFFKSPHDVIEPSALRAAKALPVE
jgi:hypothetical protein